MSVTYYELPNRNAAHELNVKLNRGDWLEWRKGGIGASEVAGVLGMSPWSTPMSIYLNKLELTADSPENEAMRWGNILEPVIADAYQDEVGGLVVARQLLVWDSTAPHRRCTLDGILDLDGELVATVQIKTTREDPWDELPDNYALQVQYELGITGFDYAVVPTLHHGNRLVTYSVDSDPDIQKILFEAVDRFWADHIVPRRPPATDHYDATTEALREAFATGGAAELHATPDSGLGELVADYVAAQKRTAEAEAVEKALANEIRARLEQHDAIVDGETGHELVTYRTQTSKRLDQKRLKADHPELVEGYLTESTSRVLRVTKHAHTYNEETQS
jgi:putative phage-type endonuclease